MYTVRENKSANHGGRLRPIWSARRGSEQRAARGRRWGGFGVALGVDLGGFWGGWGGVLGSTRVAFGVVGVVFGVGPSGWRLGWWGG